MITFAVVKEHYGWSVRMGEQMTTPFWSRLLAIREAERMAAKIRRHGAATQIVVQETALSEMAVLGSGPMADSKGDHDLVVRQ